MPLLAGFAGFDGSAGRNACEQCAGNAVRDDFAGIVAINDCSAWRGFNESSDGADFDEIAGYRAMLAENGITHTIAPIGLKRAAGLIEFTGTTRGKPPIAPSVKFGISGHPGTIGTGRTIDAGPITLSPCNFTLTGIDAPIGIFVVIHRIAPIGCWGYAGELPARQTTSTTGMTTKNSIARRIGNIGSSSRVRFALR